MTIFAGVYFRMAHLRKNVPARGNRYTAEFRQSVISDTIERLANGETTDAIAKDHGVSGIGIRKWLISDPRADQARADYLSGELMQAYDDIKESDDGLSLARARERFRAVSWLAERRLPRIFGPTASLSIQNAGEDFGERLRRAQERVIQHDADS